MMINHVTQLSGTRARLVTSSLSVVLFRAAFWLSC